MGLKQQTKKTTVNKESNMASMSFYITILELFESPKQRGPVNEQTERYL